MHLATPTSFQLAAATDMAMPPVHGAIEPGHVRARAIPMWPPWPKYVCHKGKCVENRGTGVAYTRTCLADATWYYLGETQRTDPSHSKQPAELIRMAPGMKSALVAVVRPCAVLDNSNAEHRLALSECEATAKWFCPDGKKSSIVFAEFVPLPPMAYEGKQGYARLPDGTPTAQSRVSEAEGTDRSRVRLISVEDEARFRKLHDEDTERHARLQGRKKRRLDPSLGDSQEASVAN